MIRSSSFLRSALACALIVPFAFACADTSPPGEFSSRPDAAPGPDASSAVWWDAATDPADATVLREAESLQAPTADRPVRTRLVSFATPPRWLGGVITAFGALLIWDAGDPSRHDLVALPLGRDGKARGAPRPVLAGAGALATATLAWDWRRDVVLLVADTPDATLALRLQGSGAPLGEVGRLGAGPGQGAPPVASAAIRAREGFLVAHAAGVDTVALTSVPAEAGQTPPAPHWLHLPGARRLQLADTGEGRYLAFDGPLTAGLRRLDVTAPTQPWSPQARADLLADGDGLLMITCAGGAPGEPGRVLAERLDADGRPRDLPRPLAKSALPCDLAAHLRPSGGLVLRHGRHLTRFDAELRPDGDPGHLPAGPLPPVVMWAQDAGLTCGVWKDAEGQTLDCLALAP